MPSLSELREEAWRAWFREMTEEQGLGYYKDFEDDLREAFYAGWDVAPLSVREAIR